LNDREADLRVAEEELTQRLEDLKTLREELTTLLIKADDDREKRIEQLKAMFEGMRSNDAALILASTDPDVALEVLQRMSRTKAGKVLAAMKPAQAATLAERMASKPLSNLNKEE
jgi:flagellar motility protein MotE (MotC chaperone)